MNEIIDVYYTIDEVAKMFKVTRKTIERWIKDRGLPILKIFGTVRIKGPELAEWVETCKIPQKFPFIAHKHLLIRLLDIYNRYILNISTFNQNCVDADAMFTADTFSEFISADSNNEFLKKLTIIDVDKLAKKYEDYVKEFIDTRYAEGSQPVCLHEYYHVDLKEERIEKENN